MIMGRDRSVSGTKLSNGRNAAIGCQAEYIDSAPLRDILQEQLDYLIAHSSESCAPGCEDCVRLQQVQGWLLMPFRGKRKSLRSGRAA